ncbi:hypothetical protein MCEL_06500 [Mycolicibacterium celeriflavum]|uniref:Recombinase zinc beta ribbon domain-containing protein n=1 Tax=Mycolicibacterium celeriflavum TaxID=1249101 RepID=A0A7I7REQ2_MYCCF|nr:hypothetical protein MCEL_06500 [Mycolicibacterium celeriflavum]
MRCLRCRHQLPQDARPQRIWHRYYYCRNHDPLRAGGEQHRCPERNIRADALDTFVFDHIRAAITHPTNYWPANKRSPCTRPSPTTNSSAPNWPGWTERSTPPTPNGAA